MAGIRNATAISLRDDGRGPPAAEPPPRRRFAETAPRPVVAPPAPSWQALTEWPFAVAMVAVEVAVLLALAGAVLASAVILATLALAACAAPLPARVRGARPLALAGLLAAGVVVARVGSHDAWIGAAALAATFFAAMLAGASALRSLAGLRRRLDAARAARARAEQRLRQARIRTDDFLGCVSDVHFETDAALRLRFVGPAVAGWSGLAPRVLLGATPVELAERHFGRYGRFVACEARMRERRVIAGVRVLWCDRRGRRRTGVVHAAPRLDRDGRFAGYRGVVVEVRT